MSEKTMSEKDEPNGEMSEHEFVKAKFFASAEEFAEATRRSDVATEVAAIGTFAAALQDMSPQARFAAIRWLMAKFDVRWLR